MYICMEREKAVIEGNRSNNRKKQIFSTNKINLIFATGLIRKLQYILD